MSSLTVAAALCLLLVAVNGQYPGGMYGGGYGMGMPYPYFPMMGGGYGGLGGYGGVGGMGMYGGFPRYPPFYSPFGFNNNGTEVDGGEGAGERGMDGAPGNPAQLGERK